jgi:hypothetical protein
MCLLLGAPDDPLKPADGFPLPAASFAGAIGAGSRSPATITRQSPGGQAKAASACERFIIGR